MSAIKFHELTLQNFMSYGNNVTTINLDFREPILIVGRNHDSIVEGQIDSNGAGKSAILDALSFGLYNKTISKKDLGSLINNVNGRDMEVTVTFEKNGVVYKVTRGRKTKTKASIVFEFMENGEWKQQTPDSVGNLDKHIAELIGIPFEVFSRIIVFSANFKPFLELSGPEQTAIMEELFGYTELRQKAEALKEQIKGTKAEFTLQEELAARAGREQEKHAALVASTTKQFEEWEKRQVALKEEYEATIEKLTTTSLDDERQIHQHISAVSDKLKSAEAALDKAVHVSSMTSRELAQAETSAAKVAEAKKVLKTLAKVDFDAEQEIIDRIKELTTRNGDDAREIAKIEVAISREESAIKKIEDELAELAKNICPYCNQDYKDNEEKIKEKTEALKGHEAKLLELRGEHSDLSSTIQATKEDIERLTSKSKVKGNESQLLTLNNKRISAESTLESVVDVDVDELRQTLTETEEKVMGLTVEVENLKEKEKELKAQSQFESFLQIEIADGDLRNARKYLESLDQQANPHAETLTSLEEQKPDKFDHAKLDELHELREHQDFLLKTLTKKDSFLRKALLDYSLPFLNKQLMHYLKCLGLPHTVQFQPDMTAGISQFGTTLGFGSLSSGQRARVNLALAFAFRDVLQARHGQIDFCMLDECLDIGLGNAGVTSAAKMIKQIAAEHDMSMFVISHRDEIASMFKKQMVVELRNGFSEIKKGNG